MGASGNKMQGPRNNKDPKGEFELGNWVVFKLRFWYWNCGICTTVSNSCCYASCWLTHLKCVCNTSHFGVLVVGGEAVVDGVDNGSDVCGDGGGEATREDV